MGWGWGVHGGCVPRGGSDFELVDRLTVEEDRCNVYARSGYCARTTRNCTRFYGFTTTVRYSSIMLPSS